MVITIEISLKLISTDHIKIF